MRCTVAGEPRARRSSTSTGLLSACAWLPPPESGSKATPWTRTHALLQTWPLTLGGRLSRLYCNYLPPYCASNRMNLTADTLDMPRKVDLSLSNFLKTEILLSEALLSVQTPFLVAARMQPQPGRDAERPRVSRRAVRTRPEARALSTLAPKMVTLRAALINPGRKMEFSALTS